MTTYERFKLALTSLDGTQWRIFEQLAHAFMADEYSRLRPMASMAGDQGADAMLFFTPDDPRVALQYSVRQDWSAKIRETCKRIKETSPDTNVLIYLTNQTIGPAANAARKSMREEYSLYVDVRDVEWFLTNRNAGARASAEIEEFCRRLGSAAATPDVSGHAQALDDLESKAAFVYLNLQWQDDTREKGLTRLCFDAVVRSVLRDTTSDDGNRMQRSAIYEHVRQLLPAHPFPILTAQVDGSLKRLSKIHIRHWQKLDEFCLTFDERLRLAGRVDEMKVLDNSLVAALRETIAVAAAEAGIDVSATLEATVNRSRSVLERVLLDRGEVFASAVAHEQETFVRFEDVEAVVYKDLEGRGMPEGVDPRLIASAVQSVLGAPNEDTRVYLRGLADTYTLFAFMRETPDVQSAIVKIFTDGDIWLDTSHILFLLAEQLVEEPGRDHTLMLGAAIEAGLHLHVTAGVIDEVLSHIKVCQGYYRSLRTTGAYGKVPLLFSAFVSAGQDPNGFEKWIELFIGDNRPDDDLESFLWESHRIRVSDLIDYASRADEPLRAAVNEIWQLARDVKDQRAIEAGGVPLDPGSRALLISHDVETWLGVVVRRKEKREGRAAFGFKTWWLTLDGTAFRMSAELKSWIDTKPPASPAMTTDFMLSYLSVGPVRARLNKRTEEALPLMFNMQMLDVVPPELLEIAELLRRELAQLPAHVVARKIRDTIDEARQLLGPMAKRGETGLSQEIIERLVDRARVR